MYKGKRVGVVIPAYNEEDLLEPTIKGIPEFVDRIYIVDDASTDATPQIIKSFAEPRICALYHQENRGVGAAIVTGYKKAVEENMDIAVVMGGDNQMAPAMLPNLLAPIINGEADYTKGNRLISPEYWRGMSLWRLFGNCLLTLLNKIASSYWKIRDSQNGYTAITREALRQVDLDSLYPRYGYVNDLLIKLNVAGLKVADVPIPARYGGERSKIRYSKYIVRVSPLLLRGFLWHLKMKYLLPLWRR